MALGVGLGMAAAGGVAAWLLTRDREPVEARGHAAATDAPNTAGSGIPVDAHGPGNLAVAWWPQDISLEQQGGDATLRFQSTIVNLGGEPVALEPGDRVEYTVARSDSKGRLGEVVGRGSAQLARADVEPFPVSVGVDIGRPISDLGVELEPITALEPQTAAIVGAGHASQAITIRDARAGTYTLRQQVVRADGSTDPSPTDDARLTEFRLDGAGAILHLGSRYAD